MGEIPTPTQENIPAKTGRTIKRPPVSVSADSAAKTAEPRKLNRAPQRLAAEQSNPQRPISPSVAAMTRRKREEQERKAALAEQKRIKKETEQRVAQHVAQRKAEEQAQTQRQAEAAQQAQGAKQTTPQQQAQRQRQAVQQDSGGKQNNAAQQTQGAKQKNAAQQSKAARQARVNAARQSQMAQQTNPTQGRSATQQNAQAIEQARAKAKAKRLRNKRKGEAPANQTKQPTQYKNHAPLYDQYQGMEPAQADPSQQKQPKQSKQHPLTKATIRRRKRIAAFIGSLLVFAIVVVGIVYSVNLIFRVKTIQLQAPDGTQPADTGVYTQETILAKLEIKQDDHFFSFRTKEQERILQEAFPLLEDIQVIRDYPNAIVVQMQPATETYTIAIPDGFLVLSEELRVMSTTTVQPNLLRLFGVTPSAYTPGQSLAFVQELEQDWYAAHADEDDLQALAATEVQARSDAQLTILADLLQALTEMSLLQGVTAIDLNGVDGISFLYQDRIAVLIGTMNNVSYKLEIAQYILRNQNGDGCADTDTGLLDVSYQSTDGTITTTFAQGAVAFPLGSTVDTTQPPSEEAQNEPQSETQDDAQGEALQENAQQGTQQSEPSEELATLQFE